jgi:MFS transporter, OCT family, solute carrier family 22 (organic cation transporter), member 4/5
VAWALAALHTVLTLISNMGQDPIKSHLLECVRPGDEPCHTALTQPYPAICDLQRTQWRWKSQGFSLITDFDLICGKEWLVYFTAGLFFLGMLAGCAVWQLLSERSSRRRLLYSPCLVAGVAGSMAATAPSLWLHALFRFLTGAGVGAMGVSSYVLATDVVGPAWRGTTSLALHAFFSLGGLSAALLAMIIPSWRWLSGVAALATMAYLATWSLITESPQWLLLRGKKGDATAAIAAIAFANGTRPPERPLADPAALLANPHRSFSDVVRNTRLRQVTATLSLVWMGASLAYFGVAMLCSGLSSSDVGGDGSTLELLATGFAYEIPGAAAAALAVEKVGRKNTVSAGFLQAAVCCLAAAFTRDDAQRALVVGSRFGLAAAISSLYLHTSELFPVVVQHVGLATANYAARVGAVAAPALPLLAAALVGNRIVLLVCACLCGGATVLVLTLPETMGQPAYETIQDMASALSVKRHRSWSASLQNVFRPMERQPTVAAFAVGERNV